MKRNIANCFTLLNLIFGCIAIIYIMTGFSQSEHKSAIYCGSLCICIAAAVDFLDGFIARLCNAASELGKQLDSLADLVSFGVAPGMIIFQFLKLCQAKYHPDIAENIWYSLPALIVPCAGAFRLARFNLTVSKTLNFQGLPIPASGLLIASFPLLYVSQTNAFIQNMMLSNVFWYAVIVLLSYLMVSTIPMMSMKFKHLSLRQDWSKFLLIFIAIVSAILFHWLAVPIVFVAYVLLSLILLRKEKSV